MSCDEETNVVNTNRELNHKSGSQQLPLTQTTTTNLATAHRFDKVIGEEPYKTRASSGSTSNLRMECGNVSRTGVPIDTFLSTVRPMVLSNSRCSKYHTVFTVERKELLMDHPLFRQLRYAYVVFNSSVSPDNNFYGGLPALLLLK